MDVYGLPAENGRVDYVAPDYVMNGDRVFAEPGDHIHGTRDRAGIALSVFDSADCPVCR